MDVEKNIAHGRKYGLDFLKGLAACFVVFMHVKFPEPVGEYVARIGTFAVPVFFMTSGYFSLNATRAKTLKSIKRTAMYLLVAYLLNLVRIIAENNCDMGAVWSFFRTEVFTIDHAVRVLLLSQSAISGVAWFLISLLMCYVLKFFLGKRLRYLGYLGALIGVMGVLPPLCRYIGLPINNPWINGIPFFIIGELMAENKDWVNRHMSKSLLCGAAIIGASLLVIACYCGTQWWYIGTLLLSPSLFVLFSRLDMDYNRFCLLGSTYAFFIYIVHPLVMHACDAMQPSPSTAGMWLRPVIVLAITVLLAVLYYSAKSIVNRYKIKTV